MNEFGSKSFETSVTLTDGAGSVADVAACRALTRERRGGGAIVDDERRT